MHMSLSNDENNDLQPERLELSGPGLQNLSPAQFDTFVSSLRALDITVEFVEPNSAIENEIDDESDLFIYKTDFEAVTAEQGYPLNRATRTWNILMRASGVLYKELIKERPDSPRKESWEAALAAMPPWQRLLAIDRGTISYNAIKKAKEKGELENIRQLGRIGLGLIEEVLTHVEKRSQITNQESGQV